ncbi:MAG: hypothetical protein ACFFBD_23335, partial [Candidatus Hodarchaeota archaeon]
EEYLIQYPAIKLSLKLLFQYLKEYNDFPSERELFNFGAPLEAIKFALQLLNTPYVVHEEDFRDINWQKFDEKSQHIIRQLGPSFETYTLNNLVLQGDTDLVTAKQFLALLALVPWSKDSQWTIKLPKPAADLDKIACLILRFQHQHNIEKMNLLQLAFEQRQGLVTILKSLEYAEKLIKRTDLLKQVRPKTLRTIEEKARLMSTVESTGKLQSTADPGEVATVLNLESLILALQTIAFFHERVLGLTKEGEMFYIEPLKILLEDKIVHTADRYLEQEVNKLLKSFEEMEREGKPQFDYSLCFSLFDEKKGLIPLYHPNINQKEAEQIAFRTMVEGGEMFNVSESESQIETKRESLIPWGDIHKVGFLYLFEIKPKDPSKFRGGKIHGAFSIISSLEKQPQLLKDSAFISYFLDFLVEKLKPAIRECCSDPDFKNKNFKPVINVLASFSTSSTKNN